MRLTDLLIKSLIFTINKSWPVLAVAVMYLPIQFAIDYSYLEVKHALNVADASGYFFLLLSPYLVLNALTDVIYRSVLFTVIWAALYKPEAGLSYTRYVDWLRIGFLSYFTYMLIYGLVHVTSYFALMIPLFFFFIAFPYLEVVVLFDKLSLPLAVKKNFALVSSNPVPAIFMGLLKFLIIAWVPLALFIGGAGSKTVQIYGYASMLLTVPVDVGILIILFLISRRTPPDLIKDVIKDREL